MSLKFIGVGAGAAIVPLVLAIRTAPSLAQTPQSAPPKFTATVEYVQVDARVLDRNGAPVRDLTQGDFHVMENGVPQDIATFAAVNAPLAAATQVERSAASLSDHVRPDVSTNARSREAQRIYLILLDDLFIDPPRTLLVRRFLKTFIDESLAPGDLVAITSTGDGAAFENFTDDSARLKAAVDRAFGNKPPSPTIAANLDLDARSAVVHGAAGMPPDRLVATGSVTKGENPDGRKMQQRLLHLIQALSSIEGGSKAIIFVSEGIPFDRLADDQGLNLEFELLAVSAMARRINVPVYPVDPRGVTQGLDEAIELGRVGISANPTGSLRAELDASQRRLRALAEDTGGFAVLSTNDFAAALDRVARQTGAYYLLGYYPKDTRHDGKFRKIEIKVDRPGVTVLSRRGYLAPPAKEPKQPALAGPAGTSDEVRAALNSALPLSGMTLSTTAAAFRDAGGRSASVAIVLEGIGSDLDLTPRSGLFASQLELLAVALEPAGAIKASDTTHLQLALPAETAERVRRRGFRWLSRLENLKPGRYQVRAVAANGKTRQGSVWYDLEVPEFTKDALAMSHLMIASASAFQTPTLRPDKLMGDALPGPATATRQFPVGDSIAVFAEVYDNRLDQPHDLDTAVVIRNGRGAEVFRTAETRSSKQLRDANGIYRSRTAITLNGLEPGNYAVAVEARRHDDPAVSVSRAVPFRVIGP